jgi:hypothetical protein
MLSLKTTNGTSAPVVGVGNALVDVGAFTIPARLVDDVVQARTFAAFEALLTLGVCAGAIVTPGLINAFGTRVALVVVGVIAPIGALAGWRGLHAPDSRLRVRDTDVALLQSVPMLRLLPEATIEQLAAGLARATLDVGVLVFAQGDEGDDFYVIEQGLADVIGDGRDPHSQTRGRLRRDRSPAGLPPHDVRTCRNDADRREDQTTPLCPGPWAATPQAQASPPTWSPATQHASIPRQPHALTERGVQLADTSAAPRRQTT